MPDPARITVTVAPNQAAMDLGVKAAQAAIPFLKILDEFELQPGQLGAKGKLLGTPVEARLVLETDGT